MALSISSDVYYDPYDVAIHADPYPVFRRLREEAPLYYNEAYDFYALSRFARRRSRLRRPRDLQLGARRSTRGDQVELPGSEGVLHHGGPTHAHGAPRRCSHGSSPRRSMNELEPQIRDYCADLLDPLVGADRFDFVADLGARMPMRVIGMLLGIPEQDQEAIRRRGNERLRREPGKPAQYRAGRFTDDDVLRRVPRLAGASIRPTTS